LGYGGELPALRVETFLPPRREAALFVDYEHLAKQDTGRLVTALFYR